MERCPEHMVADGGVERSVKEVGNVVRTRRCDKCGSLFKTFEMTEDNVGFQLAGQEERVMKLKRELEFYGRVFTDTKAIFEAVKTLNDDLRGDYEFGNEDRD